MEINPSFLFFRKCNAQGALRIVSLVQKHVKSVPTIHNSFAVLNDLSGNDFEVVTLFDMITAPGSQNRTETHVQIVANQPRKTRP